MANQQNLESNKIRTASEAREKGRNGGIASGKARRKKASLMRCAKRVLESDIPDAIKRKFEPKIGEIEDENDTLFTVATAVMLNKAMNGDVKAFHEIKDIVMAIEDNVYVDETFEDDGLSKAYEEMAKELDNAIQS